MTNWPDTPSAFSALPLEENSPEEHRDTEKPASTQPIESGPGKAISSLPPDPDDPALPYIEDKSRSNRLSLTARAMVIAIAVGTLPMIGIGTTAYYAASRTMNQQMVQVKQKQAVDAANQVNQFLQDRAGNLQLLANTPLLTNPRLLTKTSTQTKQGLLNRFLDGSRGYDSLTVVTADGQASVLVQAGQGPIADGLAQNAAYQEVLKTGRPIVSLEPTPDNQTVHLFLSAPVKHETNGQMIAVLRGRLPLMTLETEIQAVSGQGNHYYLVDAEGRIRIASQANALNQPAEAYLSNYAQLKAGQTAVVRPGLRLTDQSQQWVAYAPLPELPTLNRSPWALMMTTDQAIAIAPQHHLRLVLLGGILLSSLVMGALAALIANRITRPVLAAAKVVEQLGRGELGSRLEIVGTDEVAQLGANINRMAAQIQTLVTEQQAESERGQLLSYLTLRIREESRPEAILATAVHEIQQLLHLDRVAIYEVKSGELRVVAAAAATAYPDLLHQTWTDPALLQHYLNATQSVIPQTIEPFEAITLPFLTEQNVQAELAVPIRVENQVFGLLVVHHCAHPHVWAPAEIPVYSQLATQIGLALDQATLLAQLDQARQQAETISREQREQKESLQLQLVELLTEVEEASRGDLTVRADVTSGEIGTVADFFNAIIESLRQIVTQVQRAATQVNVAIGNNEGAIRQLADEALAQAAEITHTLDSVEQMTRSIQAVADNARRAAEVARSASRTAEAGGTAMDQTVQSILNLRETVAETAKKVKRLGESSQQISRVVSLINQIALQTNLLAINASIEAARAGEEGRGFAVVAEEVGQLAAQSAAATREIEEIVQAIQQETGEVVRAMELGTAQVVEGTQRVEAAKQSLEEIRGVSREIDQLVQSISSATVSQAQTSEAVTLLMKEIAKVSERTSASSRQVSVALQSTVAVARQLQESVGVFKVEV